MLGRGLNASGIIAQGCAYVFDADTRAFDGGESFPEFWLEVGKFLDLFLRRAQRRSSGSIAFVEKIEGVHGGVVDFFSVGENAFLGFELLVFAGLQFCILDFSLLEGPQVDQAKAV